MALRLNKDSDPLAPHSRSPSDLKELLAAERAGKPFLVFRDPDGKLGVFMPGHGGSSRTIGRRPEMDLSIAWDGEVSGLHAELHDLSGEWTIVDDGLSTNGTFVNDQRVGGRQRLRDEDRIRMGRTVLVYKAGGATPVQETIAAGEGPALAQLTDTQRGVLIALCRPYGDGSAFPTPASNQKIAEEVFLSVDAVKMHLRRLFATFELTEVPQNEKRARLAECVLQFGLISERDLR
ncbi:MAG TPA: FHA domain-containing protein [Solirubrobacteraceae bacterium]|nr:FHA domain-containing protein [Solirubrobacteraceae bacterium]